jgi:hypothetical protein
MSDDLRAELLKLIAEVEQMLADTRDVLSRPTDSTTTLRCVELITSLKEVTLGAAFRL